MFFCLFIPILYMFLLFVQEVKRSSAQEAAAVPASASPDTSVPGTSSQTFRSSPFSTRLPSFLFCLSH